ncbi:MAG: helix-turn-helix transcriptional regulator [Anaerolineae bacterium]|nr:helix-turn-helix transcriptional regulator [Anaerolineae bacterium]
MIRLADPYLESSLTIDAKDYTVIIEPPYPPGRAMPPHAHIQHEIALVHAGACRINLPSHREAEHLVEGDVLFFPSGLSHGFTADPMRGVQFTVIQFMNLEPRLLSRIINAHSLGRFHLSRLEMSRFTDVCHQLQREVAGNLPYAGVQCQSLVEQLAVILLRSSHRGEDTGLSPDHAEIVNRALQWLHAHSHENILMSDVARTVNLSPVHFRQVFRRAMGVSPKQYLFALRLQTSKCLLMHDRPVSEVAELAGFGSPQEFSKAFRRLTGVTPLEWKRANLYTRPRSSRAAYWGDEVGMA